MTGLQLFLFLGNPLFAIILAALWVYCLQDALRSHHPWSWVLLVLLLPPVGITLYLINFLVLRRADGRGWVDAVIQDRRDLRRLREQEAISGAPVVRRQIADVLLRRDDAEGALVALKPVLEHDPEDLRAQFLTARAFFLLGRHAEALPHAEYVVDENPRYSTGDARLILAKVLLALGERERAGAELDALLQHYTVPEAAVTRARMLWHDGRREEGVEVLRTMLDHVSAMPPELRATSRAWIRRARGMVREAS